MLDAPTSCRQAVYHTFRADRIFGEKNFGGDMVEATLRTVDPSISYQSVSASHGKAEPIAALYEQGKVHHVGRLDDLENEMISWQAGSSSWSPNRIDALVWVLTELMTREVVCGPIEVVVDRSITNGLGGFVGGGLGLRRRNLWQRGGK